MKEIVIFEDGRIGERLEIIYYVIYIILLGFFVMVIEGWVNFIWFICFYKELFFVLVLSGYF